MADENEKKEKKPFDALELKDALCFGWRPRAAEECWANLADQSVARGWKRSDVAKIDADLKTNVDACYFFLCRGTFLDLDTGFRWRAAFVNLHYLWKLELVDGKGAEVLPEDAKAFFGSAYFKKFAKRCGDRVERGAQIYRETVREHLEDGELMQVDPVKLEAILAVVDTKKAVDNLRGCKYELL